MGSRQTDYPEYPTLHAALQAVRSTETPPRPKPGQVLRDWLVVQGRSQRWLSRQLGVSQHHLSQIVCGSARYSARLAHRLSHITGMSTFYWMTLQDAGAFTDWDD